jgi:hypothetical protein
MTFLTIITSAAPNIAGILDALHEKVRARAPDVADPVPHTISYKLVPPGGLSHQPRADYAYCLG